MSSFLFSYRRREFRKGRRAAMEPIIQIELRRARPRGDPRSVGEAAQAAETRDDQSFAHRRRRGSVAVLRDRKARTVWGASARAVPRLRDRDRPPNRIRLSNAI